MGDDLDKDMRGWLQSQAVDSVADYVRRGRQFEILPMGDLIAQWEDFAADEGMVWLRFRSARA